MFKRLRRDWDPAELAADMVTRNRVIWHHLTDRGVSEATELRLDFFYESSGRREDANLAAFLRQETDYEIEQGSESYGVTGSTRPTTVSPQILDDWVAWMVYAGYEHGRCKLDGWGAGIPMGEDDDGGAGVREPRPPTPRPPNDEVGLGAGRPT